MLRRNFRNLALFDTPLSQPPNGQALAARRGCRAARPVIKYPQPREAVRRADDDQIDRTLHRRGGSREGVVRRLRGCIASQTRGGRYEFESCSSGRPRARHRRGKFARRRRGGGAGHGARCLPDGLRKLSGGCAAAHLRLLGRGGEGGHCLGDEPILLPVVAVSGSAACRGDRRGRRGDRRRAGDDSLSFRPSRRTPSRRTPGATAWVFESLPRAGPWSLRPPLRHKRLPPRLARRRPA